MSTKAKRIKLLNKSYTYRLGMKFKATFMHNLGIVKLSDYDKKLGLIVGENVAIDTLEAIEVFGWFIYSAVEAATDKQLPFDVYDVIDEVQKVGAETFKPIFEDYVNEQLIIAEAAAKANPNALGKSKK